MQKITKIVSVNFEGRSGEIFFKPHISPNFGCRELKIKVYGPHLLFEIYDPNPKNGAWGDDRRN